MKQSQQLYLFPTFVYLARSVGTPDNEAGFADGWENRIFISVFEKRLNRFRLLVDVDGIGELVCMCRIGQHQYCHNSNQYNWKTIVFSYFLLSSINVCSY